MSEPHTPGADRPPATSDLVVAETTEADGDRWLQNSDRTPARLHDGLRPDRDLGLFSLLNR